MARFMRAHSTKAENGGENYHRVRIIFGAGLARSPLHLWRDDLRAKRTPTRSLVKAKGAAVHVVTRQPPKATNGSGVE